MDVLDPLPCSLRQLQYLLAVADLGGFGRAAARCHVSQPSLSAQIALVEQALGVRVFERDRRGVRLSPAGAVVVERARQVLISARDLAETARQQADPFRGTIRVGVLPTIAPYLLADITPVLRKAYQDLSIVWSEDKTATLVARLIDGTIDGALLALEARLNGLETIEIGHDPFVLAGAPGHPLMRSSKAIDPHALHGHEVLLLEDGHCLRDQALALCGRAGASEGGYRATSLATLVQMVANSPRVTLLPSLAVPVENRRGQLAIRPFTRPAPRRTLVLAWRRGSALKTTLEALGKTLKKSGAVVAGREAPATAARSR